MSRDTRRAFNALAQNMEPAMKVAFLSAIRDISSTAQMTMLEEAIARESVDDVIRVLQLRPELFAPLDDAIRAAFLAGGVYQLDSVPKKIKDPLSGARLVIRFGGSQPRAQALITSQGGRLITNIIDSQRDVITDIIADALEIGQNPRRTALDLAGRIGANGRRTGGVIGLTEHNARTVSSIRTGLRMGDTEVMRRYLGLKARDRRFDSLVRKAIDGGSLSNADIDRMTGRLSDTYLRLRGENIARTETISALNSGRKEAVQQMIDREVIQDADVKRVWDSTGDSRTREDHVHMDGQTVQGMDAPFVAPDGSRLMHPADSSLGASAEQVIQCRCYASIKIDYLQNL